jgi:hypothetical protein
MARHVEPSYFRADLRKRESNRDVAKPQEPIKPGVPYG